MRNDACPQVLGLDIGGTSSRALLVDSSGRTLGSGTAGGGNPNSHPPEQAVAEIAKAASAAMAETDPGLVSAGVLGMAGASKLSDSSVSELFERTWASLGLTCPLRVVTDGEVAFAAGTEEAVGTVLIAGTGSIAARIEEHRQVAVAGGYGWLLGDEGSAFWLGREAVRETLRTLDQGKPLDGLTRSVVDTLLEDTAQRTAIDPDTTRRGLITAVNSVAPIRLAELAPLVTAAAGSDDPPAAAIVREGARQLVDTAHLTRSPGETSPIVLAGSLVAEDNAFGQALRAEITARGGERPRVAGPGAAGAVWLALLSLGSEVPADLHPKLVAAAETDLVRN